MSLTPKGQQPRPMGRGLPAFDESRLARKRSIVLGRARVREVATRFWLATFAGLAVFAVVYYRHSQKELAEQRNQLAARQRAVVLAAGPGGLELRDKLEAWVLQLAQAEVETRISPQASLDELSRGPGIYLRAARQHASDVESLRRAAARSLHDGFTSCLFIGRAPQQSPGVPCKAKEQCGPGELCDDWGVCSVPGQPYNLRLLYDALAVQGPQWQERLAATSDELQVRAMELELEGLAKHEVPAAAELIRRSRFFTAVLDEEPGNAGALGPDAGVDETPEQRLQATDHFVRVGIWDIARSELLVQMRLEVAGRLVSMGQDVGDLAAARARQRQANNCSAAVEVREALLSRMGQAVSASDAAAPAASP